MTARAATAAETLGAPLTAGGGGAGAQDQPAKRGTLQRMVAPTRSLVRATVNYTADGETVLRGHVYDVDLTQPRVQHALRATWIVPLPAHEQPDYAAEEASGGD